MLEDDFLHPEPAALDALDNVLCGAVGTGDHMYSRLQAHTRHADGITDTILIIDDVFLRNDMQDALVLRASHCAGRVAPGSVPIRSIS